MNMMHYKILITGADRGLGFGMAKHLVEKGHTIFCGQYLEAWSELRELKKRFPDLLHIIPLDVSDIENVQNAYQQIKEMTSSLDIIINNAGIIGQSDCIHDITHPLDYEEILHIINVNALGCLRTINQFLPLIQNSKTKRLCFVSSEASSIKQSQRTSMYGYCMSKSALNMMVKILYNTLNTKDYHFRLYHPGWIRSYMNGSLSKVGDLTIEEAARYAIEYFLSDTKNDKQIRLIDYKGEVWPW